MLKVRNIAQQPLLIHRGNASPLHLLPRGTAVLNKQEADSPQVRALIGSRLLEARALATQFANGAASEQTAASRRHDDETGETTPMKTED